MQEFQLVLENESLFGFNETVELLINAATGREWGNLANHDLQQVLAKKGKSVRQVKVIEICKPLYSIAILEKSDERVASVMMPCRISVYEKADGKIYVSTINIGSMASLMPESIQATMTAAADEMDEIVKVVTN
jgi:uncharacterized protein (DUF302 family)